MQSINEKLDVVSHIPTLHTHKNDKEKNIKKQFNYMFTFFWFLICMVYMFLPDCERLIFFLMLVFDVFFLFAAVTTTFVCTCLAYLPAQRERKAILWYVCLFAHSHRKSTQEHYHLISCASLYFMYM